MAEKMDCMTDTTHQIDLTKLRDSDTNSSADQAAFRIAVYMNEMWQELLDEFSMYTSVQSEDIPESKRERAAGMNATFASMLTALAQMPCGNSLEILLQLMEKSDKASASAIFDALGDLSENSRGLPTIG
jgi:hypothetical protein